jgi:TolB-like protein/tetratricopeptide (TPR) repeat protein
VLILGGLALFLFPTLPTFLIYRSSFIVQEAKPPLPLPDKPSIAILPFVNMSNNPEQEYFSDGITEDITSSLSKISSLFVLARNSAFSYKGKSSKVQDVSGEMGVRYVLEGSVRKAGDQVRITAQLIDATTGEHIWSERFDRPFQDIFILQDDIVQKIVTTLKLQLTTQSLVRKHTDNLEAYDYFLRAIELFFRFTKEANSQARQLLEKAVALDSQYAEAHAYLGWTYYREWFMHWSADLQNLERALTLTQQAVSMDDSLPMAHSVLCFIYAQKQQYDQAITEGERAITLDPNNADSYVWLAVALLFAGRPEDVLRMTEQAMRLNPHYPPIYLNPLGMANLLTGRYTEAIATMQEDIRRNPNNLLAYIPLVWGYLWRWEDQLTGDTQTLAQALAAAQRFVALDDSYSLGHLVLGTVYLWQKQDEQALGELERAVVLDPNKAESYAGLAEALGRNDRLEEALKTAEQALRHQPAILDYHLVYVGDAYYFAGRPEEAIAPLKQFISHYPNILAAHLTLAAAYSELGKEEEARAEVAEVLRINPQFSLEVHKQRVPIKDSLMLERHIAALRKAGLK